MIYFTVHFAALLYVTHGLSCRPQPDVDFLFYNRIPKCGSTSMTSLLAHNARLLGFTVHNMPRSLYYPNETQLLQELNRTCRVRAPHVFINHMLFPSTRVLEALRECGRRVAFINIVREPFARLRSEYNYFRWGNRNAAYKKIALSQCSETFEQCVEHGHACCAANNIITEFLSGEQMGGFKSSQKALAVVEEHFAVVGVTEQFETSLRVFKHYFPQFFADLSIPDDNLGPQNVSHDEIMPETRLLFEAHLAPDVALYKLLESRLHRQFVECVTT